MLIITALALKIRHIEDYFNERIEVAEIRNNIRKADRRAKWLYIILSSIYGVTVITLIILSFPIMNVIDQTDYNMSYLIQLGVTATLLLLILLHLFSKIRTLSKLSKEDFVQENNRLQMPVLIFAGTFYLRLVMTAL